MRALVVHELGWPNRMKVEWRALPVPADEEVLIQVESAGLNFADMLVISGSYQEKQVLPFVPGAELCGRVVARGSAATALQMGDRVMGQVTSGAYAEYATVNVHRVVRVPEQMPSEIAAGFYIPYGTSLCALQDRGRLKRGETVLILGAAGGVGLAAVQVAKALGSIVLGAARGQHKRAVTMAAGAAHFLDYGSGDLREAVMRVTDGQGVDVVLDTVGGDAAQAALRCLRFEGRLVVVGFTSGQIPDFRANHILVKNIDIVGCYWGPYQTRRVVETQKSFATLIQWYGQGLLAPHVADRVALAEVPQALERLAARQYAGKVIVNINQAQEKV